MLNATYQKWKDERLKSLPKYLSYLFAIATLSLKLAAMGHGDHAFDHLRTASDVSFSRVD